MKILFLSLLVKNIQNQKIQEEKMNVLDMMFLQFAMLSLSFELSGYQPSYTLNVLGWGKS